MVKSDSEKSGKKHPCPDCRFCQGCGDDRCSLCRGKREPGARKLSLAEQIALYEAVNCESEATEGE
ncbi:MAG TPA: hypothetical protein VIU40_01230 [Geobacteraceae bacterium]